MSDKIGLAYADAGVDIDAGYAAEVLRAFASAGEDAPALGPVVAIEAGERVSYSGRLAL